MGMCTHKLVFVFILAISFFTSKTFHDQINISSILLDFLVKLNAGSFVCINGTKWPHEGFLL